LCTCTCAFVCQRFSVRVLHVRLSHCYRVVCVASSQVAAAQQQRFNGYHSRRYILHHKPTVRLCRYSTCVHEHAVVCLHRSHVCFLAPTAVPSRMRTVSCPTTRPALIATGICTAIAALITQHWQHRYCASTWHAIMIPLVPLWQVGHGW
jgi:hypothetical protein